MTRKITAIRIRNDMMKKGYKISRANAKVMKDAIEEINFPVKDFEICLNDWMDKTGRKVITSDDILTNRNTIHFILKRKRK